MGQLFMDFLCLCVCIHMYKPLNTKSTQKVKKNPFQSDKTSQDANFEKILFQSYEQYKNKQFADLLPVDSCGRGHETDVLTFPHKFSSCLV